jgi:hypothetical protein
VEFRARRFQPTCSTLTSTKPTKHCTWYVGKGEARPRLPCDTSAGAAHTYLVADGDQLLYRGDRAGVEDAGVPPRLLGRGGLLRTHSMLKRRRTWLSASLMPGSRRDCVIIAEGSGVLAYWVNSGRAVCEQVMTNGFRLCPLHDGRLAEGGAPART